VYDASGHPLGCEVHARWPSVGDMIIASRASATSWGDGYFHIARIAPAVVEVFARHEGVDSEVVTLDLTRGESREGIAVRFARR
jgi:hypothetical protein